MGTTVLSGMVAITFSATRVTGTVAAIAGTIITHPRASNHNINNENFLNLLAIIVAPFKVRVWSEW